jgi:hypothetical protein
MRYRVEHWMGKWEIDLEAGMLWAVKTEHKGKKVIEKRTKYKRIKDMADAMAYLSVSMKKPIFEIRKHTKKLED